MIIRYYYFFRLRQIAPHVFLRFYYNVDVGERKREQREQRELKESKEYKEKELLSNIAKGE